MTSLSEILRLARQPKVAIGEVQRIRLPGRGDLRVRTIAAPFPDAATVLLLHGWTATADLNFATVFEPLAEHWGVVAPDHRGHGGGIRSVEPFSLEACAEDAAALLDQLGTGPVIVLGYSMGGPIALHLAHLHPELVSALVLCATATHFGQGAAERAGMAVLGVAGRAAQVATDHLRHRAGSKFEEVGSRLDTALRAAHHLVHTREIDAPVGPRLPLHDLALIAEAGGALGRFDARPWLGSITVPTAVVVTADDHTVPPIEQNLLAASFPGVQRFEVPGDHAVCLSPNPVFESTICAAVASVAPEWEEGGLPTWAPPAPTSSVGASEGGKVRGGGSPGQATGPTLVPQAG
jgi:3-oxoadipate enol-lactonase